VHGVLRLRRHRALHQHQLQRLLLSRRDAEPADPGPP
jgi:hypothetical protein